MRKPGEILQTPVARIAVLALMTMVTISFHYKGMGQSDMVLRGLFRQFCYLPILLAALWFGLGGGLLAAGLIVLAVVPMLVMKEMSHSGMAQEALEYVYYFLFGGVFGYLSDRERQAQRKREELVRKVSRMEHMSVIGELAAGLAHEIKNPMGSIKGVAEILSPEISPGNPRHEFMEILIEEVDRLNRVVDKFLQYAKPLKLDKSAVDLKKALEDVIQRVKLSVKDISTRIDLGADEDLYIEADQDLLKQVFYNLCLNAVQSMEGKGKLTVTAVRESGEVAIAFHDSGPGISYEKRSKIFMPFHTTKESGTGLGLTISERIIHEHGGSIQVLDSDEGGAKFRIILPSGVS